MGVLMPDTKDIRFWFRLYGRSDEEMNGGGIVNQAATTGVELRGPAIGSDDDPVLAGSPLIALTPSSTPPPAGDPDSPRTGHRLPYQPRSPVRSRRTTPGSPNTTSSPPPGIARQDSFRPFVPTSSALSMQSGVNDGNNAFASTRAWRNAAEGLAAGAGGMKSVWASISSNASAALQAAQAAYDNSTKDYNPSDAESSFGKREDLLSKGGELPTVSRLGSLGRNSSSASLARSAAIPDELSNPWLDEAPPATSAPIIQHTVLAPTPIGLSNLKPAADDGTRPWAQPSSSPSSNNKPQPPSLQNSIGSLSSSLSDLTLLTESGTSRPRSVASPRPTSGSTSGDKHQPQPNVSDIDPLGVGFR
jgi:myotubularin-related protein 6/7/8